MSDAELVDRLAAFPNLAEIPREELEWLVRHGTVAVEEAGFVIAPKGKRIEYLWILLSGRMAVQVDRGVGPKRVMEWAPGDVGGMLPYSRMKGPPGDNYLEERSELLWVHEKHFPEMTHRCPSFTARTVHMMLDRARRFNTSELQDEKMLSLGRLAAGLAHELNNPAAATVRSAKALLDALVEADNAARTLGAARLTPEEDEELERLRIACLAKPTGTVLSPIEQADREDEIADWLDRNDSDPGLAGPLAETAVTLDALDGLARAMSGHKLDVSLRWVATGCVTRSLAADIERAATRISGLVGAVKRFTYMDNLAGPEYVDVEGGLRDTVAVVAAKAKSKGVSVALDIEPDLPHVRATGSELNQVWLNLIDNALDAVPEGGHVRVGAKREFGRVVVRVVDDGPGIPKEVLPKIFDPFFTTKPPGQGTGLGLEIARRLLRQYQGDISAKSEPGRTEFRVSLVPGSPSSSAGDSSPGESEAGSSEPIESEPA